MCDLWKNTTDESVPVGAIPAQIDYALSRLPPAQHIKLYNSGNFFDRRAIPPDDYSAIIERVRTFQTVIIENHPRFCTEECVRFRDLLGTELEVAVGLETIHPQVLPRLNKGMTLDEYERAVRFLISHGISVRTFVLVRPPFLNEEDGVEWAIRSVEFALDLGVRCCAVIPTRGGNGIMEQLRLAGQFQPPSIVSLEQVLERLLASQPDGRIFADLWDVDQFYNCQRCGARRASRIQQMNETQSIPPAVKCDCESAR